jgi:hypothetical protein
MIEGSAIAFAPIAHSKTVRLGQQAKTSESEAPALKHCLTLTSARPIQSPTAKSHLGQLPTTAHHTIPRGPSDVHQFRIVMRLIGLRHNLCSQADFSNVRMEAFVPGKYDLRVVYDLVQRWLDGDEERIWFTPRKKSYGAVGSVFNEDDSTAQQTVANGFMKLTNEFFTSSSI